MYIRQQEINSNNSAYTVYREIFHVALFSQISQILLSREIKFRKSIATFYVDHVDHSQKYFSGNY